MRYFTLLFALLFSAHAASAQQFLRPPHLQRGDTVGIIAPARKLVAEPDTALVRARFESWGLHVKFGAHLTDRTQPYFAGTDVQRSADLQAMIDDRNIKAIICYQGGYGSVRLLPLVDFSPLRTHPKWLVGFSDITTLHLAFTHLGIESLHATMPGVFLFDKKETAAGRVSDESLRRALFGEWSRIDLAPHPLNRQGVARGRLTGGNLTVFCAALATPETPDPDDAPTILFIEDVGEQLYRVDRMLQQLERSGWFKNCTAILVGHFSKMTGQQHFGIYDVDDLVGTYVRELGIPVVFGVEAGHEDPNMALFMGREITVRVDDDGACIEF